ncbi:hypothetical protein [Lysobacter gummosus]|uniref:hypothetical protein n=1 Tax=Lysobacter gummosus TaxID=262324 RepID=UPI00362EA48D
MRTVLIIADPGRPCRARPDPHRPRRFASARNRYFRCGDFFRKRQHSPMLTGVCDEHRY